MALTPDKDEGQQGNYLVQQLLDRLQAGLEGRSDTIATLNDEIFIAGCLLQKDYLDSLPSVREIPRLRKLASVEPNLEVKFSKLIPAEYAKVKLSEQERQMLTHILVGFLRQDAPLCSLAAGALARTDRLSALPDLIDLLYRSAEKDPLATNEASFAVWTILGRSVTPQMARSNAVRQLFDTAMSALHHIEIVASDDDGPPFPQATARQALESLQRSWDSLRTSSSEQSAEEDDQ